MCLRLHRLALKSELLLSPDALSALREARAWNNLAAIERNNPRMFQRGASVPRLKVFWRSFKTHKFWANVAGDIRKSKEGDDNDARSHFFLTVLVSELSVFSHEEKYE